MPVSGLSGLICLGGGYFRESLFREYKEYKKKLGKSEKKLRKCEKILISKISFCLFSTILTLFRMRLFGAAHGWRHKKAPLPKICHTYPAMMKLGTVIPYLKKTQKIYESRDILLEFC